MTDEHTGDGAALFSTTHPILITEEMEKAGAEVLEKAGTAVMVFTDDWEQGARAIVRAIYEAMDNASPVWPGIDDDALVAKEAEFYLPDDVVEAFAIRCAEGKHCGEVWVTPFVDRTEEQKDVWREFVRDLAKAVADTPFRLRLHSAGDSILNNGPKP